LWRDWIGDEAAESLKLKGFYKQEMKEWNFKVFMSRHLSKVLAFDSQICNPKNWYLIKDPTDASGFLEWARGELYDSEKKNQPVYITAHMYTSACTVAWGARFKALVDRFSRIIRGQIYGHSHGEFFQLYRGYSNN
jgi:sphingomyelin phosphodiesterase